MRGLSRTQVIVDESALLKKDVTMNLDASSASSASRITAPTPQVFVVDDDVSVRESLGALIAESGYRPQVFASSLDFLAWPRPRVPCCLVLDFSLPDLNGLELQKRLVAERADVPIIFITARGDIPMSVQAMKTGAVEFLTKPFPPQTLLDAIHGAVERSRSLLIEEAASEVLRSRHQTLSRREKEVMALVVRGQLNKQVGGALGISEITVKAHRGRVMRKMCAKTLPDLVNMAARLDSSSAGGV